MFSKQTSHQLQFVAPTHLKLTCMQSNALSLSRRNALICFIWQLRNPAPKKKKPSSTRVAFCCFQTHLRTTCHDCCSFTASGFTVSMNSKVSSGSSQLTRSCLAFKLWKSQNALLMRPPTSHHSSSSRCPSAKQTGTGCPAVPLDE